MIRPNHYCFHWHFRVTDLTFRDGQFITAGSSLPVLFDAFRHETLRWYTLAYGDEHHGTKENLRLIAVDAADVCCPEEQTYSGKGPLQTALSTPDQPPVLSAAIVEEYLLTAEVRRYLGVQEEEAEFAPTNWARVRYALHLHDDCFASVEPVGRELLVRLVHSTLKLQSFYLGQDVEWGSVVEDCVRLLEQVEEYSVVSDPPTGTIAIDRPHQVIRRRDGAAVQPYLAQIMVKRQSPQFQLLEVED